MPSVVKKEPVALFGASEVRGQRNPNSFGGGLFVTQVNYLLYWHSLLPEESDQFSIASVLLRE
jgi:hypothetical protein